MLAEGYAPILIENVGRMTGMPVAPLAMSDEVAPVSYTHLDVYKRQALSLAAAAHKDCRA